MVIQESILTGFGFLVDIFTLLDVFNQNGDYFNPGVFLGKTIVGMGGYAFYIILSLI